MNPEELKQLFENLMRETTTLSGKVADILDMGYCDSNSAARLHLREAEGSLRTAVIALHYAAGNIIP